MAIPELEVQQTIAPFNKSRLIEHALPLEQVQIGRLVVMAPNRFLIHGHVGEYGELKAVLWAAYGLGYRRMQIEMVSDPLESAACIVETLRFGACSEDYFYIPRTVRGEGRSWFVVTHSLDNDSSEVRVLESRLVCRVQGWKHKVPRKLGSGRKAIGSVLEMRVSLPLWLWEYLDQVASRSATTRMALLRYHNGYGVIKANQGKSEYFLRRTVLAQQVTQFPPASQGVSTRRLRMTLSHELREWLRSLDTNSRHPKNAHFAVYEALAFAYFDRFDQIESSKITNNL